jgi:steroid delta-isomerase-like uncharacterized protein
MANQQNEEIARRAFEMFNSGDTSGAAEIIADGAVSHDPALPEEMSGPEGFAQAVQGYRTAFSDLTLTVEEMFSDGDYVCSRWSSSGTHDGDLMGIPPTGKHASVTGIGIDKIQDGKIVESWTEWDNAGLMQQLGLVGEPAGASAG